MEKVINIHYQNLRDTANLMFCLTPPDNTQISNKNSLVAWKVIKVRANQEGGQAQVKYSSRYGFGEAEVDSENRVLGSVFVGVTQGQTVELTVDKEGSPIWGKPGPGDGKLLKAKNKSGAERAISVGTLGGRPGGLAYQPTFIWTRVGNTMSVEAKLTPKLLAFINLNYQENELIQGDITSDAIRIIDLGDIDKNTDWDLKENGKGEWTLEPQGSNLKSDVKSDEETKETAAGAPKVNVNYGLTLRWNDKVSSEDAEDAIANIIAAARRRGLKVVVDPAHLGWFRSLAVSRDGETAQTITNAFTEVLNGIIDSNWTVGDQVWSNPIGKQGDREVIELIAPKSLAYYYAK